MLTIIPLGSSSEVATWWQAGDPSRLMIKCYGLYPLFTWRCFVILVPQIWGFDCATKPPKNEQFRNAKNSYRTAIYGYQKLKHFLSFSVSVQKGLLSYPVLRHSQLYHALQRRRFRWHGGCAGHSCSLALFCGTGRGRWVGFMEWKRENW